MPSLERGDVSIYYEEFGSGYPLLLFAPGGMRSAIEFWHSSPFDPTTELAAGFRVIAMDQRNAGRSRAPITAADGWESYAADQVALLDHLGIHTAHVMGGCIGSSYVLGSIKAVPERISAAVLQNPIGLSDENRPSFQAMFDEWGAELQRERPGLAGATLRSFRDRMFSGDFVFSVSREFVRACSTPLLILAGDDNFHPTPTAREIAALSPNAELMLSWKEPEVVAQTVERVRAFLQSHTPVAAT